MGWGGCGDKLPREQGGSELPSPGDTDVSRQAGGPREGQGGGWTGGTMGTVPW